MNPWFVSPLADGWCVFFNVLLLWTVQTENRRRKSIFQMSLGEWVSLTSLACLSFCFLLCLSLSHLPLWVLTLSLSLEFCSRCALTLIPPLKPTIISLSLLFVSLSLPLFLTFLNLSFPPSPRCRSLETCAGMAVWWQKHVAVPCHNQHSSMPVNDTKRHPTTHITMVARLSAGWISGKKSHFGSAPSAGYSGGDISHCGWHCSGSLCLPRSVTIIDFHSVCCERESGRYRIGKLGR